MANLVNLEDASKAYGTTVVFDAVSLGIAAGERIGVVGRNGGGKTTLLRMITGVEAPDSGRVTLTGGAQHRLRRSARCAAVRNGAVGRRR